MKIGSLFSGGGLGDFGFLAAGMEIAWQCEIDDYCQKILALRYPESKKYKDIRQLKGAELERVDIITGGFPCQPFSVAGQQMGKSDDRHLWPEMFRIISEVRPRWIVGENVPGFIDMALDDVLANLESIGYETTTFVFPSHALGAWHRRERVWIVGYSEHARFDAVEVARGSDQRNDQRNDRSKDGEDEAGESSGSGEDDTNTTDTRSEEVRERKESTNEHVADAETSRLQKQCKPRRNKERLPIISGDGADVSNAKGTERQQSRDSWAGRQGLAGGCDGWRKCWAAEPAVGRVAHGIASRVHRLKMLGNGQVPACTYVIGQMIMEIEHGKK